MFKFFRYTAFALCALVAAMSFFEVSYAADYLPHVVHLGSLTLLGDISDQVQKFWAPTTIPELKEKAILPNLTDRSYEGEIKKGGDAVYISQWQVGQAQRKQVGQGHESFTPNKLGSARIQLKADQVISHAIEFDDLIELQSQLENPESMLKNDMLAEMAIKANDYVYSLISPSTSSPDHLLEGVTEFTHAAHLAHRTLAAQAYWGTARKITLLDPQYYTDFLGQNQNNSQDFVDDRPVVSGRIGSMRNGFEVYEDDTAGLLTLDTGATATQDVGLSFRPDFLHTVMGGVEWQVASKLANNQFTYVLVAKMLMGGAVGHDHGSKCIVTRGTA